MLLFLIFDMIVLRISSEPECFRISCQIFRWQDTARFAKLKRGWALFLDERRNWMYLVEWPSLSSPLWKHSNSRKILTRPIHLYTDDIDRDTKQQLINLSSLCLNGAYGVKILDMFFSLSQVWMCSVEWRQRNCCWILGGNVLASTPQVSPKKPTRDELKMNLCFSNMLMFLFQSLELKRNIAMVAFFVCKQILSSCAYSRPLCSRHCRLFSFSN